MSDLHEKELRELLKRSIAPAGNTGLQRDLWPQMLRRLDEQPATRVAWFDWALAALLGAACLIFPGIVPALLYHL